jgi:hypothetical protein
LQEGIEFPSKFISLFIASCGCESYSSIKPKKIVSLIPNQNYFQTGDLATIKSDTGFF